MQVHLMISKVKVLNGKFIYSFLQALSFGVWSVFNWFVNSSKNNQTVVVPEKMLNYGTRFPEIWLTSCHISNRQKWLVLRFLLSFESQNADTTLFFILIKYRFIPIANCTFFECAQDFESSETREALVFCIWNDKKLKTLTTLLTTGSFNNQFFRIIGFKMSTTLVASVWIRTIPLIPICRHGHGRLKINWTSERILKITPHRRLPR